MDQKLLFSSPKGLKTGSILFLKGFGIIHFTDTPFSLPMGVITTAIGYRILFDHLVWHRNRHPLAVAAGLTTLLVLAVPIERNLPFATKLPL